MSGRAVCALGALLALTLLAPALLASAEDPAGPIGATIEIRQSAITASLYGATDDVRVTVSGTLHVATERGHIVNLKLSVDGTPWTFEVNPDTVRTQAATDVPISAAVDVPRTAAEGVYELTLRAVDADGVPAINAQAAFTVSVFRGPLAIFASANGDAPLPGQSARWDLILRNFGAVDIDYDVAIQVPSGFTFNAQYQSLQIVRAHSQAAFAVILRSAATTVAGDYAWSASISSSSTPDAATSISIPFEVARVAPPPTGGQPDFLATYWLPLTVGMAAVGVVAYFSLTEVGYLALSFSVLVPLFTRIRHEKVLDNFTRGQIFGYIQANPGAHYSAIQQVLDIENGVLAYHLRVLMREEFVVARNEGVFKRFYPRDYKIPKGRTLLTRIQIDILEAVEKAPGTTQRDVARALGESKQVISYNVGVLRDAQLVITERRGHDIVLRAAATARRDPEDLGAGSGAPSDVSAE